VDIHQALGKVAAVPLMIYPPGIPLVGIGCEITPEVVQKVVLARQDGYHVKNLPADGAPADNFDPSKLSDEILVVSPGAVNLRKLNFAARDYTVKKIYKAWAATYSAQDKVANSQATVLARTGFDYMKDSSAWALDQAMNSFYSSIRREDREVLQPLMA
jgi:hypothetical protein